MPPRGLHHLQRYRLKGSEAQRHSLTGIPGNIASTTARGPEPGRALNRKLTARASDTLTCAQRHRRLPSYLGSGLHLCRLDSAAAGATCQLAFVVPLSVLPILCSKRPYGYHMRSAPSCKMRLECVASWRMPAFSGSESRRLSLNPALATCGSDLTEGVQVFLFMPSFCSGF